MSSKRRNDQLLPESRALLSSIDDEHAAQRSFRAMSTSSSSSSSSSSSAMLLKLFGGVGVASLAIASYVSGYKSYDHAKLLGDSTGGKVVLHTGCSPVAQVRSRDSRLFFSLSLSLRGPFFLNWKSVFRERERETTDDDVNTCRSMIKKRSDWRLIVLLFLFLCRLCRRRRS